MVAWKVSLSGHRLPASYDLQLIANRCPVSGMVIFETGYWLPVTGNRKFSEFSLAASVQVQFFYFLISPVVDYIDYRVRCTVRTIIHSQFSMLVATSKLVDDYDVLTLLAPRCLVVFASGPKMNCPAMNCELARRPDFGHLLKLQFIFIAQKALVQRIIYMT